MGKYQSKLSLWIWRYDSGGLSLRAKWVLQLIIAYVIGYVVVFLFFHYVPNKHGETADAIPAAIIALLIVLCLLWKQRQKG
jgi:uncharacterized BrkB/YihY/UPF0761 family membrane protein